jgi:hypothetical protein
MAIWNPFMAGNPAAIGQQSIVGQVIGTGSTARGGGGVKRRRKSRKAATKRASARPAKRAGKRPARLVKGSAAAKAHMAKIRRKRRK